MENSTHGVVIETLDLLRSERWSKDAFIIDDITLKIEHCLVVAEVSEQEEKQDLLEDVTIVYSHEQALGQCAGWLDRSLPQAKRVKVESTAQAAKLVSEGKEESKNRAVAICPEICVETYPHLRLAKKGIQDRNGTSTLHPLSLRSKRPVDNETRFIIIGSHPQGQLSCNTQRGLLRFEVKQDKFPRVLNHLLTACDSRGLSLERLDRRPRLSGAVWTDVYFIELRRRDAEEAPSEDSSLDGIVSALRNEANIVCLGTWSGRNL